MIVVLLLIFLKLHLSITSGEAVIFKVVNLMSCSKMEAEIELSQFCQVAITGFIV